MSLDPYKRYNQRENKKEKKINDQELIFGITQKDLFKHEIYPLNRLTGNKGTSHSMPKNKNTIIHVCYPSYLPIEFCTRTLSFYPRTKSTYPHLRSLQI